MKVMILHTPADAAKPGLLLHLQEILERGSVEVETVIFSESGLPLPHYYAGSQGAHGEELREEIRSRFVLFAPDVIVLSDRLNGSKLVARDVASLMGIGVIVLKESIFPGRVFFAPEQDGADELPEIADAEIPVLESYQKFRLERLLAQAFGGSNAKRVAAVSSKRGGKTGLAIIDHSMQHEGSEAQRRIWTLIGAAKKRGDCIIVCERWRDVCGDQADCGRYVLLMEDKIARRLPCSGEGLRGLIDASDWCVTNGSLHAIEALYCDKPVIAADRCVFSGRGFTFDMLDAADCDEALKFTGRGFETARMHRTRLLKFLYRFLFDDLLAVDAAKRRFGVASEQRVIDALFRALPLERGARVLSGDTQ